MARQTTANIILSALRHNLGVIKKRTQASGALVIPVIKADAYGHGAVRVAKELAKQGVDYLAVACIEEALELKKEGVSASIIILGPLISGEAEEVVESGFIPVISRMEDIEELSGAIARVRPDHKRADVIVEVDTGMGRMGFMPEQMPALEHELASRTRINALGIFSHLPVSNSQDEDDRMFTARQIQDFKLLAESFKKKRGCNIASIANSAAIFFQPDSIMSAVRPGIMLYGVGPDTEAASGLDLRPVMRWTTAIAQVRSLPEGTCISYGRSTVLEKESRIALLPVGYADGLSRRIMPGFEFFVRGKPAPLTGVVTMDLTMVDVTDVPDARPGDKVLLLGEDEQMSSEGKTKVRVPAEEHARAAGTIPYEILTSVGKRVKREYLD